MVREHLMVIIEQWYIFSIKFKNFEQHFYHLLIIKGAIRLAGLMKLPVINIFTHDSYGVGKDGPTHQPVEQLAMLRSTPKHVCYKTK